MSKMIYNIDPCKTFAQIERRPFEEKIISGHIWDSCMKLEFSHLHEEVKTSTLLCSVSLFLDMIYNLY